MRRLSCAAGSLLALLAAGRARAHAPDAYGFGSRGASMGGALAADATDFSASYYNPAGLAGATGLGLSIGYGHASNRLRTNDRDSGVRDVHGLSGGLVVPGEVLGVPFAFGLATFLPDDGLSRIKAIRQETPRWELYDDRLSILFLAANVAVRPLPFLELGGGVAFLASTRGRFSVTGRADALSPYDSALRHEVDADLTSIRYPQLGARVRAGDLGFVGIAYRGEAKLPLSIDARLQGIVDFAGIEVPLLYELESRTVDAFLPQQVVVGASFQRIEGLRVNLDVTWVNWSAYESPVARTRAHLEAAPPPDVPLDLPDDPRPTSVVPLRFEDRLVPRLGVEYVIAAAGSLRNVGGQGGQGGARRAIEIPLRAGYVYERSPVPPQRGVTNYIDADRHTMSLGAGVVLNRPLEELPGSLRIDLHGQLSALPEVVVEKDNPADFVGDYRAGGTMVSLGATVTAAF
ncbi:OmpP1/FadL family transporter [Sorangium sp. So ce1078]|uniref:OmpP1/FadL family transporter n=1 Tax=Sorangium sp. So ce1078 TaxID=3133329 RepID=UPI003F5F52B1